MNPVVSTWMLVRVSQLEDKDISRLKHSGNDEIVLGLLDAVYENSHVSQRSLARELGIALGLTNAYLRRCVHKGFVKIRKAPANRYGYYITPRGLTEKSRLTAHYLGRSLSFYRTARTEIDVLFDLCSERHWKRITLCGAGELAEIAILCATQHPTELVQVYAPQARRKTFMGLPIITRFEDLLDGDAFLITDTRRPQAVYDTMCQHADMDHVIIPRLLKVDCSMHRHSR